MEKISLLGLTVEEIRFLFPGQPRFRAKQIYDWTLKGINNFDQMKNLPDTLREELTAGFSIYSSEEIDIYEDKSAKKIAVTLKDKTKIEAVLLNDENDRFTACLSTQVGCPAGCVFCKTGTLGFKRNLDHKEIAEQFFYLKNISRSIDNIVIMGMGEPLLNLENLRKAVSFFTDKTGMNFSRRRITVSTCGICKSLFDIADNGPYFRLALSLTTADEILRRKLMPIAKENPLDKIKEALILFQKKSASRITLEIPLLGGINTREKDAVKTAEFSKGLDTVINIIPWNPAAGLEFEGKPIIEPDKKETENFIRMLEEKNLNVTMRHRKGRSIMSACGQLGSV